MVLALLCALLPQDPSRDEMLKTAVAAMVKMQEEGQWPYEGVYRVNGQIPVGYRVGGTSLVSGALLAAAPSDEAAKAAIENGLSFVLKGLDDPLMAESTKEAYDVRVWGHACALEFLCRLREAKRLPKEAEGRVPKLVKILIAEEVPGGGWNYATRRQHAGFVTAPAVQALLLARAQGESIPDDLFDRAKKALETSRCESGAILYSGTLKAGAKESKSFMDQLPSSIARAPIVEATLVLLGAGSTERIQKALNAFHEHWEELEKRRKKTGTHVQPYGIAPYYFYYGHRYAAQAVEMLPEKDRAKERERLLTLIAKTRDEDGTWNDRVFERSKNYGTAMATLALLAGNAPAPAPLKKK
jgi:hypothetical protein